MNKKAGSINGSIEERNVSAKIGKQIDSRVYVIKDSNRRICVRELLKYFDIERFSGKKIAIKANYNSMDPFPASTHIETLGAIADILKKEGAGLILAERSGMGDTGKVFEKTGISELTVKKGIELVNLDGQEIGDWIRINPVDSLWKRGFLFSRFFDEADAIIQICCLKTHRYGGHFTMSLKNSVGMIAKYDPEDDYNYMSELHSSGSQRHMIAQINIAYEPEFVIMDGLKGFSTGGPDTGNLIEPGIMLASKDRVALDAAGVAVLRIYGTTPEVSKGRIFEQEQIAKSAQLGIGTSRPEDIEIVAVNDQAEDICSMIRNELLK